MNLSILDKYYIVENGKIKVVYLPFDKYCKLLSKKKSIFYYHKDAIDYLLKERNKMDKKDLQKLQNHFNNGSKDGFQATRKYSVNDRVHLKGTNCNGTITSVVFKTDRAYPYLKIKWDTKVPIELVKTWYDPFDIIPEEKKKQYQSKDKKQYHNCYLEMVNASKMDT